jgi:hypothetical protein
MEAARTSETSVDNYFTRQYIPEDKSELHIRSRENLKSHRDCKHFLNDGQVGGGYNIQRASMNLLKKKCKFTWTRTVFLRLLYPQAQY